VLTTGGGAYNNYLMELLQEAGGDMIIYEKPDNKLIDFKEAIIFAFLGLLRARGEINTLSSVTGATSDSSGGVIYDNYSR
jgi:anhydro-N-acetylmuramic acid kinase